ncbi:hypothetical protein AGIG_G20650 [Arapaima gigas]
MSPTSMSMSNQINANHNSMVQRMATVPTVMAYSNDSLCLWVNDDSTYGFHPFLQPCFGCCNSSFHEFLHFGFLAMGKELSLKGNSKLLVLMERSGPMLTSQFKLRSCIGYTVVNSLTRREVSLLFVMGAA